MQRRDITQTYMNTCDLYIESIKMETVGYFYIAWRRGKKLAQTLKYQSEGRTTHIKETLTLNITLQNRNGRAVEKNTLLYILDADQNQIDQITLPIHKWNSEFSPIDLPLAHGSLHARVRRKQVMLVRNEVQLNSDDAEDLESEELQKSILMSDPVGRNRGFLDSYKEEMNRTRKELEDSLYFNNKLKNDRTVLMARNLEVEGELNQLKGALRQQLDAFTQHYERKVQIRENIYEDEINQLILQYNSNHDANMVIITSLLQEATVQKDLLQKYKKTEANLLLQVHQANEAGEKLQQENNKLNQHLSKVNQDLQELTTNHEASLKSIQELNEAIIILDEQKEERGRIIQQLNQQLMEVKSEVVDKVKQLQRIGVNLEEKSGQCQKLKQCINNLQDQFQNNKYELEFTEQTWRNEKAQNEQKEEVYRSHIKRLQQEIKNLQQNPVFTQELLELKQLNRKLQHQNNVLEVENKNLIEQIGLLRQEVQEQEANLEEDLEVIDKLRKQIEGLGQSAVVDAPTHSVLSKSGGSRLSGSGSRHASRIRLSINEGQGQGDRDHIMNLTAQQLQEENRKLKDQIEGLKKQIEKLKKFLDESELAKQKQSVLQKEEHEELLRKFQQLEGKLTQYEKQEALAKESLLQKSQIRRSRQSRGSYQEQQEITDPFEKIKQLKQELNNVQKQKEEIQYKYDYLTVEMAAKMKRTKKQPTVTDVEIIQYCESQDEENQALIDEFQEALQKNSEGPFIEEVTHLSHAQSQHEEIEEIPEKRKVKRFNSIQVEREEFRKPKREEKRIQTIEEVASSAGGFEQETKKAKLIEQKKQQLKGSRETGQKTGAQTSGHLSRAVSRATSGQGEPFTALKYQIPSDDEQTPIRSDGNIEQRKSQDGQRSRQNSMNKSREASISKSKEGSVNKSNRSRQSYISGNTLYKFQKVNHREKIKRLEEDICLLKSANEQMLLTEQELKAQLSELRAKAEGYQSQLKSIEEDRNSLKASLHFQLTKRTEDQLKKKKQIQISPQTYNVEATLHHQDLSIFKQKYEQLLSEYQKLKQQYASFRSASQLTENEFSRKVKDLEAYVSALILKIQDFEKRNQHILKKFQEKTTEYDKIKRQSEIKQREYKQSYQDLKLQKAQVQFQLGTARADIKRQLGRMEELEEKVRKNDVMDILRQVQFQAETASKKIVELNRQVYQLKLEKDTIEDQSKLLRKKIGDLNKKISQKEDAVERLEKNLEDGKRKQNRLKRQIEDKEDSMEKMRDQAKRQSEQIATLKTYNTQSMFEKKKVMDEVNQLQNNLERRDYQLLSSKKELQKMKITLQQKEDERLEKKHALRKEAQKLEQALVEKDKQIIELESTVKQLSNKLDLLTNENKRTMTEKSNTYSQKLKVYIEEIAQVRKILEDSNYQNSSLKQNLNQALQELDSLKLSSNRLQQRLAEQQEVNQNLHIDLDHARLENESTRTKLNSLQYELEAVRNSLKILKADYEREKKEHQTKKQTIEELTKNNQQSLAQLNRLKVKLSDYQTQTQITKNLSQKLSLTDKELQGSMRQLRQLKINHDEYRAKYVHSVSDLETAARKAEAKVREQMDATLSSLKDSHEQQVGSEKKRFSAEIVDLLNEITRVKTESQKKSEQISELEHKLSKLETLPLRLEEMTALYQAKNSECTKYRAYEGQNESLRQKLVNLEQSLTNLQQQNNRQLEQKSQLKAKHQQTEKYLCDLQIQARALASENQQLLGKAEELYRKEQGLKSEVEKLLEHVRTVENERDIIMRTLEQNKHEYNMKVQTLEEKLEHMGATVNEHEKVLETHYENNILEIKKQLQELYVALQDKDQAIATFQEEISRFQEDVSEYANQNNGLKATIQQNEEIFEIQLQKYKVRLQDNQRAHEQSIKNLELQIQNMGKEMARLKLRNSSARNLTVSGVQERQNSTLMAVNMKRLEQKNRAKDSKIEQLKQSIFVLQESIIKLKKKQTLTLQLQDQVERQEKLNKNLQQELARTQKDLQVAIEKDNTLYASLKAQITDLKAAKEVLRNNYEEKMLHLQSLTYELQTTKELYGELQKELQKRKNLFREKTEGDSQLAEQLHQKGQRILELQNFVEEQRRQLEDKDEELEKKMQIIANYDTRVLSLEASQARLKTAFSNKANTDGQHYKAEINSLRVENDKLVRVNKKLREDNEQLQHLNQEAHTQVSLNQGSMEKMNTAMEDLAGRCRVLQNLKRTFHDLNDISLRILGLNLEQAFAKGQLEQRLNDKQDEITNLIEQVEELKFLNQRKFMDFDLLKKQNYELQLRLEDAQFAADQVEELRQICDKLEVEKKNAFFREEALRVQFQSLASQAQGDLRLKIEDAITRAYRSSSVDPLF